MKRWIPLVVLALCTGTAAAQVDTSPQGRIGRHPFGAYFDSNIDTVDLYNGNLMLNITLFTMPGRELSHGLHLSYNARKWVPSPNGLYGFYTGGWRIRNAAGWAGVDMLLTDCYGPFYEYGVWSVSGWWRDGMGVTRKYYGDPIEGECNWSSPPSGENLYLYPEAQDGSLLTTGSWVEEIRMYFPDGSMLDLSTGNARTVTANGNYLEPGVADGLVGGDTLGRTISYSTNRGANTTPLCDFTPTDPIPYYKTFTITDSNGTQRTYTLNFEKNHFTFNPIEQCWEHLDDWLNSIELPNGKKYEFRYDNFQGYLTQVKLPSGATIDYDYAGGHQSQTYGDDWITARHVSLDGGATVQTWTYSRNTNNPARTMTVTSPQTMQGTNAVTHQVAHTFNSSGQETQTDYYNNANESPLQSISTTWTGGRPTQIDNIMGSVKRRTTMVWGCQQQVAQLDESDWFPANSPEVPAWKRTTTTFTSLNGTHCVPQAIMLNEWNGSSYVLKGLTEFQYDQYSLAPTSSNTPNKTTPPATERGNLTTIRRYKDGTNYVEEHLHYDDLGNVVQTVDALGHSTSISYTDNFTQNPSFPTYAFPTTVTNALNQSVSTKYDYNTGLVKNTYDLRNLATTFTYDLLNRPLSITEANGRVTTYTYNDDTPKVTEEVLVASGEIRKTETTVDKLYRPTQVELFDPAGNTLVRTEYDAVGRAKRASLPYRTGATAYWTETTYDGLNRPLTVSNPDSSQVTFAYNGNVVTTTDEAGNQRRATSNAAGQLTKVEEPNPTLSTPLETTYSYHASGALYQVVQGAQTRTFTYDWLGRLTQEVHAETGMTTYTYNSAGLLTSRTDARGKVTDYDDYDAINRPLSVNYNDSTPDVSYTYDQNGFTGFLTTVAVAGVTTSTLEYEATADFLKKETVTLNGVSGTFATEYTYDYDGRLLTMKYPSGRNVTLTYDAGATASDRLKELTSHISTEDPLKLVQSVQDNAAGQVTGRALNNGLIAETRAFNSRNQLARIAAAANSATLLDMSYGYGSGNDGRIRSRTDAVQPEHSASYTFDAIGRLTAVSGGDSSWGIAWTLDQYGNRTTQTPTGLASSRLGSPSLTYTDNKVSGLGYDAAGNMTNDGVGGHNYTYDAENRLIQVDSGAIQYAYDYAGRRIKKTSSGVSTYYFYGLTGLTSEFSTSTTQSEVTQAATTDRFQYRIGEQTGTAVMLVGSDGTPRENNRVFPFGEPWLSFEASNNSEKFTTYQHDGESGLEYAMARYYAGGSGRFMTPDPGHVGANVGDPQSWNAYVYALNDPINSSDPSGLDPSCYVDGIEADCGLASNLLSTGAAEQCPNNLCSFSLMGQYYRYFAAAGGASGYVNFMDLPYLYEWNGHLLDTRVDRAVAQGNLGQANNLTVEQRLNNAYPVAMAALTRQSCSSLFVGRSPADALIDLFFWGESFRWDEGNLGLGPNSAAATTTLLPAYRMGPAGRTFSGSFYNLITFSNNRAGSFMTGSAMDNANTLLHELAHGYNNLRASGLSAPLILNDGFGVPNGVQNSIRNRDTIAMNCFNP